ncbi:hypothetical protein F4779DRAFT_21316 [Xylariaceae sp. FL0662B]|nr:hypothetical protein F4779DRAFT_21316 [Xylariaceae sp. FL0662B]
MAPALLYRRLFQDGPSHNPQLEPRDGSDVETNPWLIIVIIAGILVVATLIVLLVVHQIRRRRFAKEGQRQQQQLQFDPLGRQDLGRRRKMSAADRVAAEERERIAMIRKSLASRASTSTITFGTRSSSRLSEISQYELVVREDHDREREQEREREREREREAPRVAVDWKEWEAGVPSEGTHPAVRNVDMLQQHPALAPRLSVPQPARAPSPIRGVIGGTNTVRNPNPPKLFITNS